MNVKNNNRLNRIFLQQSLATIGRKLLLKFQPWRDQSGNAFLVGDAAGLSTLDMGEGIHLAGKSGLLAADAILHSSQYRVDPFTKYSYKSILRIPSI